MHYDLLSNDFPLVSKMKRKRYFHWWILSLNSWRPQRVCGPYEQYSCLINYNNLEATQKNTTILIEIEYILHISIRKLLDCKEIIIGLNAAKIGSTYSIMASALSTLSSEQFILYCFCCYSFIQCPLTSKLFIVRDRKRATQRAIEIIRTDSRCSDNSQSEWFSTMEMGEIYYLFNCIEIQPISMYHIITENTYTKHYIRLYETTNTFFITEYIQLIAKWYCGSFTSIYTICSIWIVRSSKWNNKNKNSR